ncbi:MAG: hypothetical protein ABJE95_38310 [Byssovorax sp.]
MRLHFTSLLLFALAPTALVGCATEESLSPLVDFGGSTSAPTWAQWGQTAAHQGNAGAPGQGLGHILASNVYDPLASLEKTDGDGDILLHYQTPLLDGDDVFMEHKSGGFVPCVLGPDGAVLHTPCGAGTWDRETWGEKRFTWESGQLVEKWSVDSDWKPERFGTDTGYGWEPVFHAALAGPYLVLPASGGSVLVVNRGDGKVVRRINPFATLDADNTYVSGPLTVDADGSIYYNAVTLGAGADPWFTTDVQGAWLVKIDRHGVATRASFSALVPDAPAASHGCDLRFHTADLPWPPAPDATPIQHACGSQRAGINIAPAVGPDGTIYTATRAHFAPSYSYLVAVNPDLSPKWATSLRGHLADGCGTATLPPNGQPGGCREGARLGVDPATNDMPAGQLNDSSSASPVVAPDGSVLFGAFTRYNYDRGHLMHFSDRGTFLDAYDFGWDVTPAIYPHDGTYSVIIKDNHYDAGSYCSSEKFCPPREAGPFDLTQLGPSLIPEWKFTSTNQKSCSRDADGKVTCVANHPNGFEWCINAPAVDPEGTVFANSEDGALYAVPQGGKTAKSIFLGESVGAAYTPLSIDAKGRIFAENLGSLFVVGN